ncbi:AT-hook motif nuclear-localized protein 9-like isoform X1 [Syzygium oleosum]|uniref:AT-hook motif nuclear-localized protein 9-like isoform X1 n=1 Tax=Syzygium oleosum TaxID=219896 RepID=UPI0011D267E7|nr:AT-hook motif nuclear-localized protein 9-like isoform X1 [Syzygium oleosum]
MEGGGADESRVVLQASAGLGAGGNGGDAGGGKSRSEAGAGGSGAGVAGAAVKKKRGRPRKYGVDGGVMRPSSSSSSSRSLAPEVSVKRGRGRPRGSSSGTLHVAPVGGRPTGGLGGSFGAQTVTVHRGEEILAKLSSLIQPDTHSLSVLSATGAVSSAIVRQPGPLGGVLSYEGCFEILALNGSFTIWEGRISTHPRLSLVSVMLAKPDGRVFGGGVAGPLIAAGPTQLVVATFKHNVPNELIRVESTKSYASAAISVSANPSHEVRQPEQIARMAEVNDYSGSLTSVLLEPIDKEAKATITSGNNDMNPASLPIDEHNPLEPVEPMLDRNMSTDTKANVPEL